MIKTDIIIIGAGPTGLFTVFEAGLLKLKCHLIDALPQPGGQCSEIYPKKPIYDIPGFPEILAGDLTKNLLEQCKQFEPGFTLGERAENITKDENGIFDRKNYNAKTFLKRTGFQTDKKPDNNFNLHIVDFEKNIDELLTSKENELYRCHTSKLRCLDALSKMYKSAKTLQVLKNAVGKLIYAPEAPEETDLGEYLKPYLSNGTFDVQKHNWKEKFFINDIEDFKKGNVHWKQLNQEKG